MPRYFFSIQAPDEEARAEYAAELKDDAAALAYACEIVREQCKSLTGLKFASDSEGRDAPQGVFNPLPCSMRLRRSEESAKFWSMPSSGENKPWLRKMKSP